MENSRSTEEQKGRIIPFEDFHLEQFKVKKEGVFVKWHTGGTNPAINTRMVPESPHPDFREAMDALKLYMATRLGLLEGWDFSRDNIKGNPDLTKQAMEGHEEAMERCNIAGLTYSGSGETKGVAITGSFKTPVKGTVGLSVPKILFDDDSLGYEESVFELCEEVNKEVYNFLILKKKEQANIEDQAEGFDNVGGQQLDLVTQSEMEDSGFTKLEEEDSEQEQHFAPSDDEEE